MRDRVIALFFNSALNCSGCARISVIFVSSPNKFISKPILTRIDPELDRAIAIFYLRKWAIYYLLTAIKSICIAHPTIC